MQLIKRAHTPRRNKRGLRGLHATLATEAAVSSHAVTHAHYVQPGTK
jgi:hypothetical protein